MAAREIWAAFPRCISIDVPSVMPGRPRCRMEITMTTPWPMHREYLHATQDEIARTSRHAAQLREVQLSAGHRRRRSIPAMLAAFFAVRRHYSLKPEHRFET